LRWDGSSESIDEQAASERLETAAQKVVLKTDIVRSYVGGIALCEV
jgi:hypothetical protein